MSPIQSHGKLILFGEHAVVHGRTALAVGIPRALVATRIEPMASRVWLEVAEWGLAVDDQDGGPMGQALRLLSSRVAGIGGCAMRISASIPMGAGLGSSAALAILVVRCLGRVRGVALSLEAIREAAHESERLFHGTPSGLDDSVATYGGVCLFRRIPFEAMVWPGIRAEAVSPNLMRLDLSPPPFVVGDTGVRHSTATMVARVRKRLEEDRRCVEKVFDEIETCVREGLSAFCDGDPAGLGRQMNRNHALLRDLGVSCPEAEAMVAMALRDGASGAKITGAGGGGCVVALAPGREEEVMASWRAAGFDAWILRFSEGPG